MCTSPCRRLIILLSDRHGHTDKHIFRKNTVAHGGIVDENMGHGADELAVLNDGGAAHNGVNIGTTDFLRFRS